MESPAIAASFPGKSSDGGGCSGAAPVRKRTPGRWKRIPRVLTPDTKARMLLGGMDFERRKRCFLQKADELEAMDPNKCDSEEAKIAFMAFQADVAAQYRRMAILKPQDIVLRPIQPSDTK
jgi:hypothetical protein